MLNLVIFVISINYVCGLVACVCSLVLTVLWGWHTILKHCYYCYHSLLGQIYNLQISIPPFLG